MAPSAYHIRFADFGVKGLFGNEANARFDPKLHGAKEGFDAGLS